MYSYIIKLAQGYSLIPVIFAFKQNKIFDLLKKPISLEEIINKKKINSGFLNAGLNFLFILSIIKRKKHFYYKDKINKLVKLVNKDFIFFYNFNFKNLILKKKYIDVLKIYEKQLIYGWKIKNFDDSIVDGCFLLPLLFSIKANKKLDVLNNSKYNIIKRIFIKKKLAKKNKKNTVYTKFGNFLISSINTAGVIASYRALLLNYKDLLINNPKKFFKAKNNIESHVERSLNIEASSHQHNKYFSRINKLIYKIYKAEKYPRYIMDIGCGNGSLLKSVYIFLKQNLNKTKLRKIKLIAVDLNDVSLNNAKKNLKKIDTIFIKESIENPKQIFKILKTKNIKKANILQLRSFVDHERDINPNNFENLKKISILEKKDDEVYGVDEFGKMVNSNLINKSLFLFYKKWSKFIGRFGLINLEVHKQSIRELQNNLDINEGVYFDFIQVISMQYLCKAKIQHYCMKNNNLDLIEKEEFPANTNFKRIILSYYKKNL